MSRVTIKDRSPRGIALDLLQRVEEKGGFVDRLLVSPSVMKLETRDRLFIRELLSGVLRNKLRLDTIITKYYAKSFSALDPVVRDILRLGLYQLMYMDSVPDFAAVNESAKIVTSIRGKGAAGLVNAVLRRFGREGEPPFPDDPAEKIAIETSHPLWLVKRWIEHYGLENTEASCRAGNEKHPVFVRAQRSRITPDDLVIRLDVEGFESLPVQNMPGYLKVPKGNGLFETQAFSDGLFTAQDPPAGMAGELLAPSSGESVLDLCAAPGGKATHCAEIMGNCGTVTAVDIHSKRLRLVNKSAERLGLDIVSCVESDAGTFGADADVTYDRVLLDAPCSGTGVLSKRLDMRWRITEDDIARLVVVQKRLLANAARLVRPGGVLVYSTCSLEKEENEGSVADFLSNHKDFSLEHDHRFDDFEIGEGYLILPHRMNGIGAFAAKMKRASYDE